MEFAIRLSIIGVTFTLNSSSSNTVTRPMGQSFNMASVRISADFQNADALGRIRLNCVGTARDLAAQGVELREGMAISLYTDDADDEGRPNDLVVVGTATYANEERCWVAVVDWTAVRQASQVGEIPRKAPGEESVRPVTFNGQYSATPQPPVNRR
jgi:hypothetical protein